MVARVIKGQQLEVFIDGKKLEGANSVTYQQKPEFSISDAERLQLAEVVTANKRMANRRGSWFTIPNIKWTDRDSSPARTRGFSMSMEKQRAIYDKEQRVKALGPVMVGNKPSQKPDYAEPAYIKHDKFVDACVVTCMHCLTDHHFGKKVYWADPKCPQCDKPLWPNGGWQEANIARRLTGDFRSFNIMLMFPPLDDE